MKYLPLVLHISIKFTTFSCFNNCNILISLKAVIGNCKQKKMINVMLLYLCEKN